MKQFINISDIVNPDSGLTYREENSLKVHNIALNSIVEIDFDEEYTMEEDRIGGLRLYVVSQDRDFDGTPLYSLSFMTHEKWKQFSESTSEGSEAEQQIAHMMRFASRFAKCSGYSEGSLKVISTPNEK